MHNDFIICGPADDPAGIKGEPSAAEAYRKISKPEQLFVSRGDDSGTHKRKKKYGQQPGLNLQETGTLRPVQEWAIL